MKMEQLQLIMKRLKDGLISNIKIITLIIIVALFFNLIWEYLQCGPFFIHKDIQPTHYDMFKASLGDVLITLFAFFIIAWLSKSLYWVAESWNRWHWFAMISLALIISFFIELFALRADWWAYTEISPLIFGQVSALPVLQLLLLFPLVFYLAKKIFIKIN